MACTFLNISFLAFRKVFVTNEIKYAHIELETPNSYIGLERAVHDPNAPPPKPISNFPLFTTQINHSEPNTVYYEHNRHFTNFGTAWPTDRKFRVATGVGIFFSRSWVCLTISSGLDCRSVPCPRFWHGEMHADLLYGHDCPGVGPSWSRYARLCPSHGPYGLVEAGPGPPSRPSSFVLENPTAALSPPHIMGSCPFCFPQDRRISLQKHFDSDVRTRLL